MNSEQIIYNEDGERSVRVYQSPGLEIMEIFLVCSEHSAKIVRMNEDDRPETFKVSTETMTRIAKAWLKYLEDEQAEGEKCLKEAYAIAEWRGMKIEQVRGKWRVLLSEHSSARHVYSPRQLLAVVKELSEDEELFPQDEEPPYAHPDCDGCSEGQCDIH